MSNRGPYRRTWSELHDPDYGPPPSTIGAAIRKARRQADLTQAEAAVKIGVARTMLTMWERDDRPIYQHHWTRLKEHLPGLAGVKVKFVGWDRWAALAETTPES